MTPTRTVRLRRVGHEGQPVAIIDDFAADPGALRAAAAAAAFEPAGQHYPGVRAALPPDYFRAQMPVIGQVLHDVFGATGSARVLDASFSIVTMPPAQLSVPQRLPHVDATQAGRIALLHYLAPGDPDGTAFFRHRATGFETIDAARGPAYFAALGDELRALGDLPDAYIAADSPLFERTAVVEAAYNRALIYRSSVLHSGAITAGRLFPAAPLEGRLTVTGFLAIS